MKQKILSLALFFLMTQLWSQGQDSKPREDRNFRIPLIGEAAPTFTAESTEGTINFPLDFGKKWKILFSHPQDFTPVCTTEILELGYLQNEFDKLGIKLLVLSTDPLSTHISWKTSMESLNLNNRGLVKIKFPLIDDQKLAVSKQYGMIHATTNSTKAVRGVFVIDPENVIQAIFFYPMVVGRNTDELLRVVTALQETSKEKVMTPVNWRAGNDLLVPVPPTASADSPATTPEGYYSPAWYLWFKKVSK